MALVTVRVRCSPMTNIYAGLEDVVHAAIFLGRNQVDLAVEPDGIDRVSQRFTNLNGLRLLSSDPLFTPEGNRSYAQTAFLALNEIRRRYYDERNNTLLDGDQPLADWYTEAFKHFDQLIVHYQKQC
ncbi:uncharacterized protein N7473_004310 [Penicillium subrubescens]|uniref:uncharacterized protein n=1 Tax=Penicillium subrubescens TaxID=1316194 RepID=UPI0025450FF4|nr:uncharacterized protein N7473_004310 [Penicillium subrubescens]KAJ5900240.1 hypothetical protein N7473_004310 [Penicillium subrubescens]